MLHLVGEILRTDDMFTESQSTCTHEIRVSPRGNGNFMVDKLGDAS